MEETRILLHEIINKNNFILTCDEVVDASKKLDKLILKYYLDKKN